MGDLVTRIPAEELGSCEGWLIPEVGSKKVVPGVQKKSRRDKKESKPLDETSVKDNDSNATQAEASSNETKDKASDDESIEVVEDVEIKPITAEQLEQITRDAEKEGFDSGHEKGVTEGKEQGYQEGMDEAKKTMAEQAERLQHIVDALITPLENEHKDIEKQMLDMICQLTTAVVQKELNTDSSEIIEAVKKSLSLLPSSHNHLTLYLNSQDIDLIKNSIVDIPDTLVYQVDDDLMPGGCRLESKESSVDFSVEQRLQTVLDDFLIKQHVNPDDDSVAEKEHTPVTETNEEGPE